MYFEDVTSVSSAFFLFITVNILVQKPTADSCLKDTIKNGQGVDYGFKLLNGGKNIIEDKRICLHVIQLFLAGNNEIEQSLNLKEAPISSR